MTKHRELTGVNRGYEPGASAGLTLLELMVALCVFLILGSAAVMLVRSHVALYPSQQGQAALNIQLRNSIAQMQIDVMNAGVDYYPGVNAPGAPIGLTIQNQTNTNCFNSATRIYEASCFDTLTILAFDSIPPARPTETYDITSVNRMTLVPANATTTTAAQLAAAYKKNSELLLITGSISPDTGTPKFMTVYLSEDAVVDGSTVTIAWTPGDIVKATNLPDPSGTYTGYYNKNERYALATYPPGGYPAMTTTSTFDTTAVVLKLSPIVYWVKTTDPHNPQLVRTEKQQDAVIADSIVGFKVGAMTWGGSQSSAAGDESPTYLYDPNSYKPPYDFSLIRSVRISLIGRTAINPTSNFVNSFDGGHYRVEAVSAVVSPRNLSMHDQ
ncbi:MAG: hypothetical protein CXZ00_15530 [Acidobacteria bacterium]|nr:MAG: hypothetical protein CXZ00_15530 [Acidobacteriota bacterium]